VFFCVLFLVLERKGLRCHVWGIERWRDELLGSLRSLELRSEALICTRCELATRVPSSNTSWSSLTVSLKADVAVIHNPEAFRVIILDNYVLVPLIIIVCAVC
jgi:hypothetical protein